MMTCLGEIPEPGKTLTSTDHISDNIVNQDLKFFEGVPQDCFFTPYEF